MTRKVSSSEHPVVKSYRIITGGEDSQLCFWRFDRKEPQGDAHSSIKSVHEEVLTNAAMLQQLKPLYHISIYVGQLQSISLSNDLIFIMDSEGVLTVIKAQFRTSSILGKKTPDMSDSEI